MSVLKQHEHSAFKTSNFVFYTQSTLSKQTQTKTTKAKEVISVYFEQI